MTRIILPERQESLTSPPPDLELVRNVEFGKGGDRNLLLHILRPAVPPASPMPVLVGIHGSGWRNGTKDWCLGTLMLFAMRGYFTVTIDHRYIGEAPFPSMIHDCKCAIRYLRAHAEQYHLDSDHIGVWGSSSGGHLAALLGTSGGVAALEGDGGWAGYSSRVQAVSDWFGPTAWLPKDLLGHEQESEIDTGQTIANPINHISKDTPPFLIMHGDKDESVSLASSVVLYEALIKANIEATLVVSEGAGHALTRYDTHSLMIPFFDKHLRGA